MGFEFYIYIAISAGAGTAIIELLLKSFLSDWLQRRFHNFSLKIADKRECARLILELINLKKNSNWTDLSDDVYNNAYLLSDRLITLKQEKFSQVLDDFVSAHRNQALLQIQFLRNTGGPRNNNLDKDFINSMHKTDELREDLVKIAQKLIN